MRTTRLGAQCVEWGGVGCELHIRINPLSAPHRTRAVAALGGSQRTRDLLPRHQPSPRPQHKYILIPPTPLRMTRRNNTPMSGILESKRLSPVGLTRTLYRDTIDIAIGANIESG